MNYTITLPPDWPPPGDVRDFCRANCWSIEIPDLPVIPGGSTRQPQRFLSWFYDRYPPDFQKQWIDQHFKNGYTHVYFSYADACGPVDNGPNSPPGSGLSLTQFVDCVASVKAKGLYTGTMIGSKYFQPHHMTAQQWADFADPIMDALMDANAIDEFVLGWEWNLWNTPGNETINAFKHAGQRAHARGCSFWQHYGPHTTSWFADGDPAGRFGFYDALGTDVDGINYQTQPEWSCEEMQARIVDSLWQFGTEKTPHKFRLWEDQAMPQFDNNPPSEADSDLRGYLGVCTVDNVKHSDAKVWGYGNGGRMPDGMPL